MDIFKIFYKINYRKFLVIMVCFLLFNFFAFSIGYSFGTNGLSNSVLVSSNSSNILIKLEKGNTEKGKKVFQNLCADCHYTDRKDFKMDTPGLKGILKEKILPVSKKPATPDNIKNLIRKPYRFMPPFPDLSDEEIADIIEYLKTL